MAKQTTIVVIGSLRVKADQCFHYLFRINGCRDIILERWPFSDFDSLADIKMSQRTTKPTIRLVRPEKT